MSVCVNVASRRLAVAALAAAAVVGGVALPASAADHRPQPRVEISSVQYDSPGREDGSNRSLNREWVEITNTARRSVNLDGWTLENEDGQTYTFDHYRLGGRATVRVHTGIGRDTDSDVYQDRRDYVWDNDSDTAVLRNDRGRFVDDASWGRRHHHRDDSWGRHHRDGDDDRSWGRHHRDGDDDRSWEGRHHRDGGHRLH